MEGARRWSPGEWEGRWEGTGSGDCEESLSRCAQRASVRWALFCWESELRLTLFFIAFWLAVGAAFDAWRWWSDDVTVTDAFRWLAFKWPGTVPIVIGGLALVVAHLFIETLYWRRP